MTATLKNKNYKRSQKGRSMVEMLGVLAIVGVLSVGGVYGYGVAMKKHKANELLHQASMLATTISAQAMTNDGNLPQTITSFGNSNYGTFSTTATEALDGKGFSITIENVDSGACTQLEKMAGGMVRDVDCDEATGDATITYYKNLATTEAEGEKSPTGGSGAGGDTTPTTCPTGTSEENTGGSVSNKVECKCPANKKWNSGSKTCVDDDGSEDLYVTGDPDNHLNMTENGAGCPSGYHWASSSEFMRDYNCTYIGQSYLCSEFGFSAWLNNCWDTTMNESGLGSSSCNDSLAYAFKVGNLGTVGDGYYPDSRSASYPALCRR